VTHAISPPVVVREILPDEHDAAASLRLARPDSPWARRLYSTGTPKFARAERRAKRWERAAEIVVDAIGGRFGDAPDADRRDARSDHTEPN
jgi:hypothetical protein